MAPAGDAIVSSPDVRAAIAVSHLRRLAPSSLAGLTEHAVRSTVRAGSTMHREGEVTSHLKLVLSGVARIYVTAPDGRTMTIRYCRQGALIGVATLFEGPRALPVSIQAVIDTDLLALQPSAVREAAERDVGVARALIGELSERVCAFIAEIPGNAFATVTQRVARHLLDLASTNQDGPELVAITSQQALADAVGTVREVVVRAIRELRGKGLVVTTRHGIALLDARRLADVAYPMTVDAGLGELSDRVRDVPGWNKGH